MSEDRKIVAKFRAQASRAITNYDELVLAVHNKRNQQSLETLLAEQLVMSVAVAWEAFLTDLIITYLTLDANKGVKSLKDRIVSSVKDRYGTDAARILRFSVPKSLSKARVAGLVDPKGWNFSLATADSLSQKANDLLAGHYAKRFTLEADDSHFLDFLVSIRNYLGHRSDASRTALKDAISALGAGANASLNGALKDIGTYLKTKDESGKPRAVIVANRLIQIAGKL